MPKPKLTENMRTAMMQLHGTSRTAKEARIDARTLKALERIGYVRSWASRKPIRWSLTPEGVEAYNRGEVYA